MFQLAIIARKIEDRRQQDQRHADAVDAEEVVDVEARDPRVAARASRRSWPASASVGGGLGRGSAASLSDAARPMPAVAVDVGDVEHADGSR